MSEPTATPSRPAGEGEEPFPSHPAGDGPVVVCASCGHENPAGADKCQRTTCRRTLPGNRLSYKTGIYAIATTSEQRAIETAGRALAEQSVADAGGRVELGARELSDHEYRGLLHIRILKLAWALDRHGDFDGRGRLRVGWIRQLESLISTALSLDKTLGLRRRARPVPTLDEVLGGDD